MASTTFINYQTVIDASWLNDVNNLVYNGVFQATSVASPPAWGGTTPNTGKFTALTATTSFTSTNDANISGLTVGKGGGAVGTNTVVGNATIPNTNTGTYLAAFGYATLLNNSSGSYNTALGPLALINNTTGSNNVGVGSNALAANTTASNNTAVGYQAGYSNTTGTPNTYLGYQAGYAGTGQTNTTGIGYQALSNLSGTPDGNTGVGGFALQAVTTGASNTALGYASGYLITTGSKNTIIGRYSGNQGGLDIRTASNYIVLSDGDGNLGAYVNGSSSSNSWFQRSNSSLWGVISDQRIKKNVKDLTNGLLTINSLKPKEFDYIINGNHDIGFIAQEYATVLPAQIIEQDASGDYATLTNGEKLQGIQQNLIPYLVSAIQELSAQVTALQAKVGA